MLIRENIKNLVFLEDMSSMGEGEGVGCSKCNFKKMFWNTKICKNIFLRVYVYHIFRQQVYKLVKFNNLIFDLEPVAIGLPTLTKL